MTLADDSSLKGGISARNMPGAIARVRNAASLAPRLRTGCVYELQPRETFGLLVMRSEPKRGVRSRVDAWWPQLAPSLELITARSRDRDRFGWDAFTARYRAELQDHSRATYLGALIQIGIWLKTYPTVTLLSLEHIPFDGEAHGRSQRHILRAWLLGQAESISEDVLQR